MALAYPVTLWLVYSLYFLSVHNGQCLISKTEFELSTVGFSVHVSPLLNKYRLPIGGVGQVLKPRAYNSVSQDVSCSAGERKHVQKERRF